VVNEFYTKHMDASMWSATAYECLGGVSKHRCSTPSAVANLVGEPHIIHF
jgi:hypothetical protein